MSQPKPNLRRDMGTLSNDELLAAIAKATKDELANTAVALGNELIRRGFHPENTPVAVIRALESVIGKGHVPADVGGGGPLKAVLRDTTTVEGRSTRQVRSWSRRASTGGEVSIKRMRQIARHLRQRPTRTARVLGYLLDRHADRRARR